MNAAGHFLSPLPSGTRSTAAAAAVSQTIKAHAACVESLLPHFKKLDPFALLVCVVFLRRTLSQTWKYARSANTYLEPDWKVFVRHPWQFYFARFRQNLKPPLPESCKKQQHWIYKVNSDDFRQTRFPPLWQLWNLRMASLKKFMMPGQLDLPAVMGRRRHYQTGLPSEVRPDNSVLFNSKTFQHW